MLLDHEKLHVYRAALEFAAWSHALCGGLKELHRAARDQLLRASQSIALNIAEGNGRRSRADRRRFFEIARGSALESAAILDILTATGAVAPTEAGHGKELVVRIVSMLSKMTTAPQQARREANVQGKCD
jgi:four helix bundle protein